MDYFYLCGTSLQNHNFVIHFELPAIFSLSVIFFPEAKSL